MHTQMTITTYDDNDDNDVCNDTVIVQKFILQLLLLLHVVPPCSFAGLCFGLVTR